MSTATETTPVPTPTPTESRTLAPVSKAEPILPRAGDHGFDDFLVVIQSDQKADLLDGVIHMASPESLDANSLFLWLAHLMSDYVEPEEMGVVYGSRVAFRLNSSYGPEPDIAFVRTSRLHLRRRAYFDGPPDLAVEIVSPDSVARDYQQKREAYRLGGVREYWIVDDEARRVTVHRLDNDGRYDETVLTEGRLTSTVIPGFWVDVSWLWTDGRPSKSKALAAILAERSTSK